MQNLKFSITINGIHIEGYPDATKIIKIKGNNAQKLSNLSLHENDLRFAKECLEAINNISEEIIREALWSSAIIYFIKCFGNNSSRSQLSSLKLYKNEPKQALEAFEYFKNLRNKHFVHDENSYSQSIPGAILNDGTKDYKIEKIVCSPVTAVTLENQNWGNLKLLIERAIIWVQSEFEETCKKLTEELEKENYDDLMTRDNMIFSSPPLNEINKNRKGHIKD
jgi:hypothetical protein